jgi:coenzyme F420-0:L-glutamate ligase / coenzyme F420-1:gamma-L-glutamate ligase
MDPHSFLRSRRSVRRFLPDPVPQEVLQRVLESACWAPSAHNRQPWRLVLLSTPQARETLLKAMHASFRQDLAADHLPEAEIQKRLQRSRSRISGAPLAVLVCVEPAVMDVYADTTRQAAEDLMASQSAALCAGTLLLAAHGEGLGGVWICAPLFAPQAVLSALDLPPSWRPQVLILLGFPAEIPDPRPRLPLAEVVVSR